MSKDLWRLIGVAVVILVAIGRVYILWRRRKGAANWPTTEGIIQSACMEVMGAGTAKDEYPCFTFSYGVDGESYSGRFVLEGAGGRSSSLIQNLINTKVTVRYSPRRPSEFDLPEDIVVGCVACRMPN